MPQLVNANMPMCVRLHLYMLAFGGAKLCCFFFWSSLVSDGAWLQLTSVGVCLLLAVSFCWLLLVFDSVGFC